MILDKISNKDKYECLSPRIKVALDNITEVDYSSFEPGEYAIDEKNIFALVSHYTTKSQSSAQFEAHKKYIDVQYMISGTEWVGYTPYTGQATCKTYHEEHDYALYDTDGSFFKFSQGMFAIFFPDDLHKPSTAEQASEVKKLVIKVRI